MGCPRGPSPEQGLRLARERVRRGGGGGSPGLSGSLPNARPGDWGEGCGPSADAPGNRGGASDQPAACSASGALRASLPHYFYSFKLSYTSSKLSYLPIVLVFLVGCFFVGFFFFWGGCSPRLANFPGQGLNPLHRCNQSHSSDPTTLVLNPLSRKGTPVLVFFKV